MYQQINSHTGNIYVQDMGEEARKSKVLVVGGTGFLGRRIVKASLHYGHETYILQRRELRLPDLDKLHMLLDFKARGAHLVEASYDDHQSLVDAVRKVDVVICAISGTQGVSNEITLQLKLVEAIKEAGNVKRFLPSEFGSDVQKQERKLQHAGLTFVEKAVVRDAIEAAGIPHTYIISNLCVGYFAGGLGNIGAIVPSKHSVQILGDGTAKAIFTEEDDVAAFTIKAIDDPRTLNKQLHVRVPENILSQRDLVDIWERLLGKVLDKTYLSGKQLLAMAEECQVLPYRVAMERYHQFFVEGTLSYELNPEDLEATKLYPEVKYTTVEGYFKRFL